MSNCVKAKELFKPIYEDCLAIGNDLRIVKSELDRLSTIEEFETLTHRMNSATERLTTLRNQWNPDQYKLRDPVIRTWIQQIEADKKQTEQFYIRVAKEYMQAAKRAPTEICDHKGE